jgi:hypothetical protein
MRATWKIGILPMSSSLPAPRVRASMQITTSSPYTSRLSISMSPSSITLATSACRKLITFCWPR